MADEVISREMIQCTIPHPQQSITSSNHIHRLCDDLLKEILLRLPTCKSVIQIKCVCRRWDALTSHPSFSVNFIRFKLKNGTINLNNQPEMFAYVLRYEPDLYIKLWEKQEFQSFFAPSIFQLGDSSFTPLHCLKDENIPVSMPVASSQDLLLYCRHESDKYDYYISNVQTRESVMLPSSSSCSTKQPHQVGLICDPFYSSGREVAIDAVYNYSIVAVCRTSLRSTKFCAHVFSTHCGSQWCDKVLSLPQQCQLLTPGPASFSFCFNGKLYFSSRQGLFGFDHNSIAADDEIQCHLVRWPVGMLQGNHKVCVLQGRLHACAFDLETSTFKVWILEDYKEDNWMLQHSVGLSDWLPCDPFITTKLQKFARHHSQLRFQGLIRVLGFHPSRSDAIYLLVPGFIFLCDLSTKAIEFACRIPVAVAEEYQHYLSQFYIFPVKFQMWPTPLPPLTQHNSCICSRALA